MPVTNLREFTAELNTFSRKLVPEQLLLFQKKVALELFKRIIFRTPVGNPDLWSHPPPPGYVGGRARGNWQMSFQTLNNNETGAIDPSGTGTLSSGMGSLVQAQPFGTIWIFNNVPYIIPLEYGWSGQAPAGMVRISLAEMQAYVDRKI